MALTSLQSRADEIEREFDGLRRTFGQLKDNMPLDGPTRSQVKQQLHMIRKQVEKERAQRKAAEQKAGGGAPSSVDEGTMRTIREKLLTIRKRVVQLEEERKEYLDVPTRAQFASRVEKIRAKIVADQKTLDAPTRGKIRAQLVRIKQQLLADKDNRVDMTKDELAARLAQIRTAIERDNETLDAPTRGKIRTQLQTVRRQMERDQQIMDPASRYHIRQQLLKVKQQIIEDNKEAQSKSGVDQKALSEKLLTIRRACQADADLIAKQAAIINEQKAQIAEQNATIASIYNGLKTIRKQVVLDSARNSDKAFRDHIRGHLVQIREEVSRLTGESYPEEKAIDISKDDNYIPASHPSKVPLSVSDDAVRGPVASTGHKVSPLGRTAVYIAAARAIETKRESKDRIVNDPHAAAFAEGYGNYFIEQFAKDLDVTKSYLASFVAFRTRYVDDCLSKILKENSDVKQIVLLGVGCDTRAYRMDLGKDLTMFHVDRSDILSYRSSMLSNVPNKCAVKQVAVSGNWVTGEFTKRLVSAGFDPKARSVVVCEGVLCYLEPSEGKAMLAAVSDKLMSKGSFFIGDLPNLTNVNLKQLHEAWNKYAERVKFGADLPEKLLETYGMSTSEYEMLGCGRTNYNNRAPPSFVQHMKSKPRKEGDEIARIYVFTASKK